MGPAQVETPREETAALDLRKVSRQLGSLWVPVLFGGISTGIRTTNLSYLGLNFFAQQYTDLRPAYIHCEDTPEAAYCQAAINDNLFWVTTIGAIGSVLHFVLGPFLGALSDAIGRRPVILLCSLLGYPSLISLALFVYRNVSMYITFALMPFGELPVLAIWFAYIVDLIEAPYGVAVGLRQRLYGTRAPAKNVDLKAKRDNRDSSVAFGLVSAVAVLSTMIGAAVGAVLSIESGVAAMMVFDIGILLPYLVCFLPETLPVSKRQALQWRAAAPGLGLSILASLVAQGNQLFVQLSTLVIGSTFIGTGFQRVSASFLQKYIRWPKSSNNLAIILGGTSSILWSGVGLSITHKLMGDVGSLGFALWAGAMYMLCFAFITQSWQVYVLNAVLLGPQALSFPAISAIKSRLVDEHEQGLLQGALTTGKSIAECIGPILFGFLFEAFSGHSHGNSEPSDNQFASRIPILIAFLLCLPLLCLCAMIPQKLADFEQQLLNAERSINIEMENLEAEDVSLLDPSQRDKLL